METIQFEFNPLTEMVATGTNWKKVFAIIFIVALLITVGVIILKRHQNRVKIKDAKHH